MLKTLLEKFKLWRAERQFERNKKTLQRIIQETPDLVKGWVLEHANAVAVRLVMRSYDEQGIRHCVRCPERFGLIKTSDGYCCLKHIEGPRVKSSNERK